MKAYTENDSLHTYMQLLKGSMVAVSAFMLMGVGAQGWEHPSSTLFELEGNIVDGAEAGDDWKNIEDGSSSAFATTDGILHDDLKKSIFTGGGSKDVRDINLWKWTHGSVPDKDEIIHAAAAAYKAGPAADQLMIYLTGDRFATDGSAQMGVWFFQENVTVKDDGTFDGRHKNGDVLMLAEFVRGGVEANINLYIWDNTQKNNLRVFVPDNGVYYTALSNENNTEAWSTYTPKSGIPGVYPPNAFFEGGINLSWIFKDVSLPCFSSFLMETRSSHRVNAQLKDFVLGQLNTCKLDVTKECLSSTINTSTYDKLDHTYKYTVTNSGFGTIDSVSFTDDAGTPNDPNDDDLIVLNDVGPLEVGQEPITGQYTYTSSMNPPTNTIYATGHIGEVDMATVSADATCTKVELSPSISVDKTCKQSLEARAGHVVVRIDYGGQVCNDQNGTLLTNVTIVDSVDTDSNPFDIGNLYPEDDPLGRDHCKPYSAVYYPNVTSMSCAHNSRHGNTVTATGKDPLNVDAVVKNSAGASCTLCDSENCKEPTPAPE